MVHGKFHNLFVYNGMYESGGKVYFEEIRLHKVFPDEEFVLGDRLVGACVDPIEGTVVLYTDMDDVSKEVKIKEWIDADLLRRTDTISHWPQPKLCRTDSISHQFPAN